MKLPGPEDSEVFYSITPIHGYSSIRDVDLDLLLVFLWTRCIL